MNSKTITLNDGKSLNMFYKTKKSNHRLSDANEDFSNKSLRKVVADDVTEISLSHRNTPCTTEISRTIILCSTMYTRKKGAGVKNHSVIGDGENVLTPIQQLYNLLSQIISFLKDSKVSQDLIPKRNYQIEVFMDCCIPASEIFFHLIAIEKIVDTIIRLLDDRAAMLRRKNDDPSDQLLGGGACLLTQEIYKAQHIFTALLVYLSSTWRFLSEELPVNSPTSGSPTITTTTTIPQCPPQTTKLYKNLYHIPRYNHIRLIFCLLIEKLRCWLGTSDNIQSSINESGVCRHLLKRVELGMCSWLKKCVVMVMDKFVEKDTFLRVQRSRKFPYTIVAYSYQQSSTSILPSSLSNQPSLVSHHICSAILSPFLKYALSLTTSPVLEKLLCLAICAVVNSFLDVIMRRQLRINNYGIHILHSNLEILVRWAMDAKVQIGLPTVRNWMLIELTLTWRRANGVLIVLQRACDKYQSLLPVHNSSNDRNTSNTDGSGDNRKGFFFAKFTGPFTSASGTGKKYLTPANVSSGRLVERSRSRSEVSSQRGSHFGLIPSARTSKVKVEPGISKEEEAKWLVLAKRSNANMLSCLVPKFIRLRMKQRKGAVADLVTLDTSML